MDKQNRLAHLRQEAQDQLKSLSKIDFVKSLKRKSDDTYLLAIKEKPTPPQSDFNNKLKKGLDYNPKDKDS